MLNRLAAFALLLSLAAWAVSSYVSGGLLSVLLDPDLSSEQKLQALRSFFDGWGALAPGIYVLVVVVEVVVAPIPGMMLYLPGGVIFGGFWGGLLSLVGNVLGAGLSCAVMRSIVGRRAAQASFPRRSLDAYRRRIERHGTLIIALLRANPLTSSDLVSYAAGLTTMPLWKVLAGTLLGMTPICFVQSYLAQEIFGAIPWLIWPMISLCMVYAVVVVTVILRLRREIDGVDPESAAT